MTTSTKIAKRKMTSLEKKSPRVSRKRTPKKKSLTDGIKSWVLAEAKQSLQDRVDSVRASVVDFFRLLTFRFFLLVFSFVGFVFLLIGMSRYLGELFRTPGVADVLVGATILSLSALLFVALGDGQEER